jgi:hypothetical protein
MRKSQLKTFPTEQLVEEFRRLSAEHRHAIQSGNPRAANRKFSTLVSIIKELRARGLEAQRQLLKLLADPEPATRSWAASAVLEIAPSEAEQVLEEVSRTQRNTLGFSADWTLKLWREGAFNPPWASLRNSK